MESNYSFTLFGSSFSISIKSLPYNCKNVTGSGCTTPGLAKSIILSIDKMPDHDTKYYQTSRYKILVEPNVQFDFCLVSIKYPLYFVVYRKPPTINILIIINICMSHGVPSSFITSICNKLIDYIC